VTRWRAVIFDLGGVVLDSPLDEIARFEHEREIPPGTINRTVVGSGSTGAWARHERGELDRAAFLELFSAELVAAGARIDSAELMDRIDSAIRPRASMVRGLRKLRASGFALAAITNNWIPFGSDPLVDRFDVFLESVVEGVRKPEPEIYRRCVQRLAVPPETCVMLDDLGPNLKPARAMGMYTIKVTSQSQALEELGLLLEIDLG
jgi:putative hydrolase of the HAD superfamily